VLVIHHLKELPESYRKHPTVLTVGVFDGVHIAHQSILQEVVSRAKGSPDGQSVVYTFEDHPLKVLKPEISPLLLVHTDEKNSLIENFGIQILVNETFTLEFSNTPPDKFITDELCKWLNLKEIIVGHDHGFGKGGSGNVDLLTVLGKNVGFTVHIIPPIQIDGMTISSSVIRELLLSGNVAKAAELLGRPHSIIGKVVMGFQRGRTIGFPTANLLTEHEVIPGRGVYAVQVQLDKETYPGIMNIGQRPSFPEAGPSVEVHLLGFDKNIYGTELKIFFIDKIRDEVKFDSIESLREQIQKDEIHARTIFHLV
jgi:riboflavin kinase/FMN adenylyltransferase